MAANPERGGPVESIASGSARLWVFGMTGIALGLIGMFGSSPFIYGDPLPGQAVTDPPWFPPIAGASILLILLGGSLMATPAIRRSRSRPRKP
jgi:hypothetical protein